MKPNYFWFFKLAVWLVIVTAILLLFVYPFVMGLLINAGRLPLSAVKYLSYVEMAQVFLMQVLGLVWIFFLGSCFASFLNVVAWRVPRGRGINGSSQCPYCNVKLGFRDNIPIAGWLRNKGRCSNCRLPISPRYLIVEFILGFVFLFFSLAQLLSGGMNLPLRAVERLRGFEHLIFDPKWDLIQLTVYHLVLICLLFTFVLIRSEKLKIPLSIFSTGCIFGIGLPMAWPSMLLVSWQIGVDQLVDMNRFSSNQLLTIVIGLTGGVLCGGLIHWSCGGFRSGQAKINAEHPTVNQTSFIYEGVAGLALVGLFLGWQSAISITILYFVVSFLPRAIGIGLGRVESNLSICVLTATILHLLCWRLLTWLYIWPSPSTHWAFMVASLLVLAGLAIVTCWQTKFAEHVDDDHVGEHVNDDQGSEHIDDDQVGGPANAIAVNEDQADDGYRKM